MTEIRWEITGPWLENLERGKHYEMVFEGSEHDFGPSLPEGGRLTLKFRYAGRLPDVADQLTKTESAWLDREMSRTRAEGERLQAELGKVSMEQAVPLTDRHIRAMRHLRAVDIHRLANVIDALLALDVIRPYMIGLPYYGEHGEGRQEAIERWLIHDADGD